jgi:prolyl oligopeptidase
VKRKSERELRPHINLIILVCFGLFANAQDTSLTHLKQNVIDTYWGTAVADPYRWLESVNSDTTKNWLDEQQKITRKEKQSFSTKYTTFYSKLDAASGYMFPNFTKEGPYYFSFSLQSEFASAILYYKTSFDGDKMVAFDPNKWFTKNISRIDKYSLSEDARYLAVTISKSGSDWREIKVRDLSNSLDLTDKIDWVKFSDVVWFKNGFFYSRFKQIDAAALYTATNTEQQLYYHKLGNSQNQDQLVYSVPPKASFSFEKTSDNKHLVFYTAAKIRGQWCNVVAYKNLEDGILSELKMFIATPAAANIDYKVIDLIDGQFAVSTNFEAPHYRVLLYNKDSVNYAQPLINEYSDLLENVYHIGTKLVCLYFRNGRYTTAIFNYKGEMTQGIKFIEGAGVSSFSPEEGDTSLLYFQSTFYTPPITFRLNLNTNKTTVVKKTEVYYDADKFTTKVVTYKSKDGTEIPMYLTYKKGLKLNGKNPVILYGYGGFGVSVAPFYDFANIILYENSGILAVPLIRGGGELGMDWHDQGRLLNKQNTFDDFIAAAEYLIDSGYTNKGKLAIKGGSNGGLLVAAVLTQRPELFQVVIGKMGVYDMLRYHLFTVGGFYKDEYGASTDSAQFFYLKNYSPLHNIKEGVDYPATLLVTAENDDRVPPLHTYKFLATLQEKSSGTYPHIMYFEEDAGHAGGETYDRRNREKAFELAFIFKQMKISETTNF